MTQLIQQKISILIPSYNHAEYIEDAIRSVWGQNYSNLELVIIDDGSTDGSCEIIARLKAISPIEMIFFEQKNGGICRALNQALEFATGSIIGVLASDDVMLPDRLSEEVKMFDLEPLLKVLYSNGQFHSEGKIYGELHNRIKPFLKRGIRATREHLLSTTPAFYIQAMLIRREFLIKLGRYDEVTGSDDWSLNIRIFQALQLDHEFIFLDRYAFLYRVHAMQMHREVNFMTPMKRRVVRKFFTLENRSKFACENYVRQAFNFLLQGKIRLCVNYLAKAHYIGFSDGIPLVCLIKFFFYFLGFIYRKIVRWVTNKVFNGVDIKLP